MKTMERLGIEINTKIINGYKPHFKRGYDYIFLITGDYWVNKIVSISKAFKNHKGKIFGVLNGDEPSNAKYDWIATPNLILIKLEPLSVGRWNKDRSGIEYIEIESLDNVEK